VILLKWSVSELPLEIDAMTVAVEGPSLSSPPRTPLPGTQLWDDFVERVSGVIGELPLRRRQVLVMLLFALSDELISPEELQAWMAGRDVDSDEGVEEMIAWLRQFRPGPA
jgi:hypothetical protein